MEGENQEKQSRRAVRVADVNSDINANRQLDAHEKSRLDDTLYATHRRRPAWGCEEKGWIRSRTHGIKVALPPVLARGEGISRDLDSVRSRLLLCERTSGNVKS